ncbi:MAG: hypothetical protein QXU03_01100 [Desulfurococcaceae archaeon]
MPWKRVYLVVLVVVVALVALTLGFTSVDRSVTVGVYFYVWYSSDSRHWNDSPVTPVTETPVIGFYDSRDEHVVGWQLKLLKNAGVDFIVISWWGPGSFEDEAAKIVIKHLRDYGLKFTIFVEPYLGNEPALYNRSFWENTTRYIRVNYIEPYGDLYFHLHGKPLILAFNPIGLLYRPDVDFPEFTIRIVGNDIDNAKYQDWDYWPDYLLHSDSVELRVRRDNVVSIIPRYCDTHFRTPGVCLDPDLSQGLYRKQWEWILRNADKVSIVMITSWNEYHERTQIEPSFSNETRDPWLLYDTAKEYIALLRRRNTVVNLVVMIMLVLIAAFIMKHAVRFIKKLI